MGDLRLATPGDAAPIRRIYGPYVTDTAITFETTVPSVEELEAKIAEVGADFPWLVAEADDEILGYAYAHPHRDRGAYDWAVETSVYVDEEYQRAGVASSLYETLFELLERQGHVQAYAGIALPNPQSVGFHGSMGFAPVGTYENVGYKHGDWHDVEWWAKEIQEPPDEPESPRSIDALEAAGVVSSVL
jgi:phosphinothricin acetyltransferase